MRLLKFIITTTFTLLVSGVGAAQTLEIERGQKYDLVPSASFAIDTSGDATIDEARLFQYQPQARNNASAINLGYEQRPVWMRIEFDQLASSTAWSSLITLGTNKLTEVSLFHFVDGEVVSTNRISENQPFSERPIPHSEIAFFVPMQRGHHELYFRITSNLGVVVAPALMSGTQFYQQVTVADQVIAFFYGALTILLIYNFLVFLTTREVLFLSHTVIMVAILLWNLASSGTGFQYLWPNSPEFTPLLQRSSIALFSAALGFFSHTMFRRVFWPPLVHKLNLTGIAGNLVIIAFPVFKFAPMFGFIILCICPVICAYLSIEVLRRGLSEGYYYAVAWAIFVFAFVIGMARVFGWIPLNIITDNIALIAVLSSVAVMSHGLAGRIKVERIARAAAEESTRGKMEFLANMSHEIRTPMNAVLGFADLALTTGLNKEQKLYLDKIQASSKSLMNIINDILDYSKIESGRLELEQRPFSIEKLCQQVLDMFEQQATDKSLQLIFNREESVPDQIVGDSLRLGQILINLVGNAIKFTDSGSVSLSLLTVTKSESDCRIKFVIRDTGIGISPEQKQHLFQPFSQADSSTTRKYGGTGLGLSISRQLAELMGAAIQLESEPGKGSEFSFELNLPITAAEEDAAQSSVNEVVMGESENKRPWEGTHVLLVEDNQVNQLLAQTMLSKGKVQVEVANNGREAIRALQANSFDLVLMDVQMPVMDGYEATRSIRKELKLKDLPVIAMTANAMESDRECCLKAGMNDFLPKPIDKNKMYHTIGQWTGKPTTQ